MTAKVFLDTNVLLYACSSAPADETKQAVAEQLILEADFAISAQVMQEFIANALRKKSLGISESQIEATMELLGYVPVLPITRELVLSAIEFRRRFQLSHWDACILAAAGKLGCAIVYSEDLNHNQDYDGIRVLNPFQ